MKTIVRCFVSMLLLAAFFLNSVSVARACGPYTLSPYFSLTRHADYPLADYNAGKTGVVPETFDAMDLFVFYRQLAGAPFTQSEQKQVANAMETHIFYLSNNFEKRAADGARETPDFFQQWTQARAKISDEKRDVETEKRESEDYDYYPNCLPDAFRTATKTLEARVAKYGNGAEVKEWLKGQDAVFANCGTASGLPENLAADAPEWLRQDRAYQIAAAEFYAGDMPAARAKFEEIGADASSDWSRAARFVAARTLIREANFVENADEESAKRQAETKRRELFEAATQKLEGILSDAAMSDFHQSARRLIGLVKYRLMPEERRRELAAALARPAENPNLYNDLTDYSWLLGNILSEAETKGSETDAKEAEKLGKEYDYNYKLKLRDVPAERRVEDLTDWIVSYKAVDSFQHAFEKWKATGTAAWLVAALAKTDASSPQTAELLREADKIAPSSPAFATVRYHQIRLLLGAGNRADARRKLDEILGSQLKSLPISSQNKFLAQRLALAENLDEFLKFAQRRAAIFDWDENDREEGTALNDSEKLRAWETRTMFDTDAVAFFNEKMPLSVLRQAALNPQLPAHLKRFLVIAVWTRAFALRDQQIEREFTPLMQRYGKDFAPFFEKYAAATAPANREANGLIAVLRYPVLQPYVPVGFGREDSEPTVIDSNRGNWWCAVERTDEDRGRYDVYPFSYPANYPNFLSASEQQAAAREHRQLMALGNSATALARRAIEFANQNPQHAQTPEILHLAVRATRYGCTDEATGNVSKQAFDILHKRYPKSSWAKETPYWFN